jgi:hypothetical protein
MEETSYYERITLHTAFKRAFAIFRQHVGVFLPISAVTVIPFAFFLAMFIMLFTDIGEHITIDDLMDNHPDGGIIFGSKFFAPSAISMLVFVLSTLLGRAAISRAVAEVYIGQKPRAWHCIGEGYKVLCSLLGAGCLIYFGIHLSAMLLMAVSVGLAVGIPVFGLLVVVCLVIAYFTAIIYVGIRLNLFSHSIVIESKGPIDAIMRSWVLTKTGFWYLFLSIFLMGFLNGVITTIFDLVGKIGSSPETAPIQCVVLTVVLKTIPMFFFVPFTAM